MIDFSKYLLPVTATIKDALIALNGLSNDALVLFVVNEENQLQGTISDGDIRRFLIKESNLLASVRDVMNTNYRYVDDLADIVKIRSYKDKGLLLVPYLDSFRRIIKLLDLKSKRAILPFDAVLMAGGKGERLRPLTEKVPKPLLHVGDKAIIDYNIERLMSYGIEHLHVTVNYLKEQIEDHFREERDGIKVNCIRESQYLGTIGSVKFVETFYNDTVLVMNSDLFTNIDYEDFYLHFKQHDADMSVAAVPYGISVPYGIFELDGRDIKGIKEKPTYNYYANAGIYLIKRKLLELIPENSFFNATDFIEMLVRNQLKVVRFPLTGYWIDIGKHEDYRKAQELVKHF